jgi:hypothetical protein
MAWCAGDGDDSSTLPVDFRVDNTATSTAADVRKVGSFGAATTTARGGGANLIHECLERHV